MSKGVYYNEFDKHKVMWLRHLIEEGAIAKGIVDDRPIQYVQPDDLKGFDQHHFFAGVGVHSYALRRSGWPDDEPIWSGSCPCGPFSIAGLQKGFNDPRHLWPEWFRLISICRPDRILGEQVADASAWIDLVSTDLESHGYAFGSPDIPAAGFSGAHRRQRFFFMADTNNTEWWAERAPWNDGQWPTTGRVEGYGHVGERGSASGVANTRHGRSSSIGRDNGQVFGFPEAECQSEFGSFVSRGTGLSECVGPTFSQGLEGCDRRKVGYQCEASERAGSPEWMADVASCGRWEEHPNTGWGVIRMREERRSSGLGVGGSPDWIFGRDKAWRPVEPGTFPLADATPSRVGLLRGYGDAIDAEALTEFIGAYMDCCSDVYRDLL